MTTYVKLLAKEHPNYVMKKGDLWRVHTDGNDSFMPTREGEGNYAGRLLGSLPKGPYDFNVLVPQEHYDAYMDEWVEQDRVPARAGIDQCKPFGYDHIDWMPVKSKGCVHNLTSKQLLGSWDLRCKRRDLPPTPTPPPAPPKPEYPKIYGTLAGADIPFILVRTSATECYELSDLTGWLPGKPMPWNSNRDRQISSGKLTDITNDCNLEEHCESRRTSMLHGDFARLRRVAKTAGQSIDKMRAIIVDQQRQIDDLHSIAHSKECGTLTELNQNPQWKPIPGWRYVGTKPQGDGVYVHSYVSMDQRQCPVTSLN